MYADGSEHAPFMNPVTHHANAYPPTPERKKTDRDEYQYRHRYSMDSRSQHFNQKQYGGHEQAAREVFSGRGTKDRNDTEVCNNDLVELMTQFLCLGPPQVPQAPRDRRRVVRKESTVSTTNSSKSLTPSGSRKKSSSSSKRRSSSDKKVLYPIARYPDEEHHDPAVISKGPRRKSLTLGPNIAFRPVTIEERDDKNCVRV